MNNGMMHLRQHGNPEAKAKIAGFLLESMKLSDSDVVVDVGSGDGYYSSRFAEHCKKVLSLDAACDVFKSEYYSGKNIETVCEDACTWIAKNNWGVVTHVFFSNSFHDLNCQKEVLSILAQDLPLGAHIDMIEFHPETLFGPPKSRRLSHQQLVTLVTPYRFEEKNYINLDTHYFITFEKTKPN